MSLFLSCPIVSLYFLAPHLSNLSSLFSNSISIGKLLRYFPPRQQLSQTLLIFVSGNIYRLSETSLVLFQNVTKEIVHPNPSS